MKHLNIWILTMLLIPSFAFAQDYFYIGQCVGAYNYAVFVRKEMSPEDFGNTGTPDLAAKYFKIINPLTDKVSRCEGNDKSTDKIMGCIDKLPKRDSDLVQGYYIGLAKARLAPSGNQDKNDLLPYTRRMCYLANPD